MFALLLVRSTFTTHHHWHGLGTVYVPRMLLRYAILAIMAFQLCPGPLNLQ